MSLQGSAAQVNLLDCVRLTPLVAYCFRLDVAQKKSPKTGGIIRPFWLVLISPIAELNLDTSVPTIHDESAWTSRDSSSGPAYRRP